MLTGKRILLGVTGGIAAYKSAFLVREFVRAGAEVQVVMTRSAAQFITPLTMAALSKRDVVIEMFPPAPDQPAVQPTRHIDLALWGDVMLIAPATANTIAKITHGAADNFLTTLVLALRCPLILAPAMDVDMYLNEMTQTNIAALRETGCIVLDPDAGELASGLSGPGRMPEVDRLFSEVARERSAMRTAILREGRYWSPRARHTNRSIRCVSSATDQAAKWGSRLPAPPHTAARTSR